MNIVKLVKSINIYNFLIKIASKSFEIEQARNLLKVLPEDSKDVIIKKFVLAKNLIASEEKIDQLRRSINFIDLMRNNYPEELKKIYDQINSLRIAKDLLLANLESKDISDEIDEDEQKINLTPDDYLYHITFFNNLSSISSSGLMPGSGQLLGHGGNRSRSSGKIFLTNYSGIMHWYGKIEDMAEYRSDNLLEDELVPVVLRTEKHDSDKEDPTAEQAGLYDEYKRMKKISPEDLEVWDGSKWISVNEYESIDITQALIEHAEDIEHDEYDESDEQIVTYYSFKYSNENPLIPK